MYDIEEYAKKAKAALSRLEQTQKPGELSGKGNKSDVIMAIKSDIQKLLEKGYTSKQIATALKEGDVFGILPKTITEIVQGKKAQSQKAKVARKKKTETKTNTDSKNSLNAQQKSTSNASFEVKPDTEDL
ncbi:hypothetical protein [Acidithiobacillus acidisediminis]|uniref:hypothetical protein n=1 Tax=Acidithiobacillus acidisediminis TaxID=2937799 RepID=UPI00200F0AAB|nr:hypothetical protein [Acidithiobacillus sp. S30A2]